MARLGIIATILLVAGSSFVALGNQNSARLSEPTVVQPDDGSGTVPLPSVDPLGHRADASATLPRHDDFTQTPEIDQDYGVPYTGRVDAYGLAKSLGKDVKRKKVDVGSSPRSVRNAALSGGETPVIATVVGPLPYSDAGDFTGAAGTDDAPLDCGHGDPTANVHAGQRNDA